MTHDGKLRISAASLHELIDVVVPKRRTRPYPVTLRFVEQDSALILSEAKHALRQHQVYAEGNWPAKVQVQGVAFSRVCRTYRSDVTIDLVALSDRLVIAHAGSQIELPRLDPSGSGGIVETLPPPDPRHAGPVAVPPDRPPSGRFAWGDTWGFSARVPIPQHRKPREP